MTGNLTITDQIKTYRQNYSELANKVYFNFGGQGIMSDATLKAIVETYQYIQKTGPFSLKANSWITQRIFATKYAIAKELGTTPETITLTENVTTGCNIVLWGLDWQSGDRILMTDCEHPGVIAIIGEIVRRFGVEVDICPIVNTLNQGDPVEVISQYLTPRTRLLVLSHLLWNTGQVLPLANIVEACHNYTRSQQPVRVLVDAAQSVGSLPLNLSELKADYYAFTGHKWLCGPAGVGGLYVRPELLLKLYPTFIGWRSVNIDNQGQVIDWKQDGQKFEIATSAYPQYEGLTTAIETHQKYGNSQERYQRICQLSQYLWQQLSTIKGIDCLKTSPPEAGLVSFQITNKNISYEKFVQTLEEQGFFLRTIAEPNCLRACVHYFHLTEEIDRLIEAIEKNI